MRGLSKMQRVQVLSLMINALVFFCYVFIFNNHQTSSDNYSSPIVIGVVIYTIISLLILLSSLYAKLRRTNKSDS